MPERVVVCNTSPLLYLHQVSNLELFAKLYGELTVPPAVESELRAGQERGIDVPVISEIEWIRIRPPSAKSFLPALVDLGPGEAEVIALGLEFQGSLLVLDDQLARRIARVNQLSVTGTLGILLRAKEAGFLRAIRPILEQLQKTTMWLPEELVHLILAQANELKEGLDPSA